MEVAGRSHCQSPSIRSHAVQRREGCVGIEPPGSHPHAARPSRRTELVAREVFAEAPRCAEYRLTALGNTPCPVVRALQDWAEAHADDIATARANAAAPPTTTSEIELALPSDIRLGRPISELPLNGSGPLPGELIGSAMRDASAIEPHREPDRARCDRRTARYGGCNRYQRTNPGPRRRMAAGRALPEGSRQRHTPSTHMASPER
ncbi:winged helix-turn-helix transcriptional regulator [Rhodococcus sp. IEGM 1318]|uniref:winged helix-turn-helix transcriptional regulator n=1 Tax=Rhodococcus sp. IEGM 1318 TaxID=3082226 RepID=UPI003988B5BA